MPKEEKIKKEKTALPCLLSDDEVVGLTEIGKIAYRLAYDAFKHKVEQGDDVVKAKEDGIRFFYELEKIFVKLN